MGLTVVGGKAAFPYFGADGRPERDNSLGQPLPLKASSYPLEKGPAGPAAATLALTKASVF